MRPGLAEYDLASLLYDPYVALTSEERGELLRYYKERRRQSGVPVLADFSEMLRLCAIQRLMQALGAYGFLGLVKGNKAFLEHVPAAVASLRSVVADTAGLEKLFALFQTLDLTSIRSD
jgi:aminoglycoside/choline kinase family phosphotransferase